MGGRSFHKKLRGGIILGSNDFVDKTGHLLEEKVDLKEIPRRERYAARKSLSEIFGIEEVDNIDTVMEKAYKIYGYTLREIGDFPGVHYSTVSKRIKMMEGDT